MATVTAPERTAARHQSLLHFVGSGAWSDKETPDELPGRYSPLLKSCSPEFMQWKRHTRGL
ncbi:SRSO17 transposase [Bradyrhizobium sp. i1.8.4]